MRLCDFSITYTKAQRLTALGLARLFGRRYPLLTTALETSGHFRVEFSCEGLTFYAHLLD